MVHDTAVADVDAVLGEGEAWCNEMGAERWRRAVPDEVIGSPISAVGCAGCAPRRPH